MPEGEATGPGVVVLHDIMGFSADLERHCDRFAAEGYAAIGPDLYDGGSVGCMVRTLLASNRGTGAAYDVIAAARRVLVANERVDPARIAVTGFCMGGGFALICAADDAYAVAAPFYGETPGEAERLNGICPTLAQYGELDRPFLGHARRLERHLSELDVEHEVIVYEGVGHSFMNDHGTNRLFRIGKHLPLRAEPHPETAEKAWAAMLAWFEKHMPAA